MTTSTNVISFHYTVRDKAGTEIDSSSGGSPLSFLQGQQEILPALETILISLKVGDKKKVELAAKDAYGEYDPTLVVSVPRAKLPDTGRPVEVGDSFRSRAPSGEPMVFTVTELGLETVKLDANHPLAGQDLIFDVELTGTRAATAEEMTHGHVHGPGGHHH